MVCPLKKPSVLSRVSTTFPSVPFLLLSYISFRPQCVYIMETIIPAQERLLLCTYMMPGDVLTRTQKLRFHGIEADMVAHRSRAEM